MQSEIAALYPAHIKTMTERFDRALAATGFDEVVISSGTLHMQFLDDVHYPFKVNPQFKAWLPLLDNPWCLVRYRPGDRPVLVFHRPEDFWHKPPAEPDDFWTSEFDIHFIAEPAAGKKYLPEDGTRYAFLGEIDEVSAAWRPEHVNPPTLLHHVDFERAAKTAYELACMREASRLGVLGHLAAEKAFRNGATEYGIFNAFCEACSHTQDELPYAAIIALNENAATLHYQMLERESPAERRTFLIDAGASFAGYASDITRTHTSGTSAEFDEIHERMETLQQQLCEMVRPGTDYREIHLAAHQGVGTILEEMRFVRLPAEAIVETGISATFMPHGVGHLLGLQVHDVGGFLADREGNTIARPEGHPMLRLTRAIDPDMVVTIEPGFYFIESLLRKLRDSDQSRYLDWELVDRLRPCGGIRIEDDVRATNDAPENLTRDQFARLAH